MPFLTRLFGVTDSNTQRNPGAEQAIAEAIADHALQMQSNAATRQLRKLCRGTHAKGTCVRAILEVFDVRQGREPTLAGRLAKGIFAAPGRYPAIVRFANSDPSVKSDFKPDVRSLSFFVDLTCAGTIVPAWGVGRQDFSMQSAPTLPLNDAPAFLATMKVLTASSPLRAMAALPFNDKLRVARAIGLAQLQTHQAVEPYQKLRYWSTVPFRHGAEVVKQCATPLPANPARALPRGKPDALQTELARHVDEDSTMSQFDIGLQFLDTERMTYWGKPRDADFWIENASVMWPESVAPFHTVARLSLVSCSRLSHGESEATYFDVTANAAPDSVPVGSINRVRWRSESASRHARLQTCPHVGDSAK